MLRDILIKEKGLSRRESEVAELVARGLPNKDVATRLFVTEKTVKFHLTNIYKKMALKSRAQLIIWCMPQRDFTEKVEIARQEEVFNREETEFEIPTGIRIVGHA